MSRMGTTLALALLATACSVNASEQEQIPRNISPLIGRAIDLNDKCRGPSGDQYATQDACSKRDAVFKELEEHGWCHNEYVVTIGRPPKEWQLCSETKPPRYDVPSYCGNLASLNGARSETLFAECMKSEQISYNDMKEAWIYLPQQVKDYCAQIATVGGEGAYSVLEMCAKQEMESKRKNNSTQFQY